MPIYDYIKKTECSSTCKIELEIFHRAGETVEKWNCDTCGKEVEVSRAWGNTPVHYKGTGFYTTDYRKADNNLKKFMPRETDKKYY